MIQWGLKTKILLLTVIPTFAIALLLGCLFLQLRFSEMDESFIAQGETINQKFAPQLQALITTHSTLDNPHFQTIANAFLEEIDVRAVSIYDADKNLLAHAGPTMKLEPSSASRLSRFFPTIHPTEQTLRLLTPIISPLTTPSGFHPTRKNKPLGWIELELTQVNMDIKRYQLILITCLIILLSALINGLLALKMSKTITESIQRMISAIHRIKEGHLETRIHSRTKGEIHQLENSINNMAEFLQGAQEELKHNVDQTAEDLRETLETIEIQNIELDLARKEALEASRIKSEFLANMSHEIRTPLNGIIGFTRLLLKESLNNTQYDYLDTIHKSSEGLLAIINDILDFSKMEAGKLVLDHSSLNIRTIIEDVLTLVAPLAHDKKLELISLIYADVPTELMGDALRLKQVLINLVNNAIKFTEQGNVILRVVCESRDGYQTLLKVSITDTGIGLSTDDQKMIFSAFNQADASAARRFGGTGLGLVISKHLVEHMGGNIGLTSEPGKGSTFWFTARMDIDHAHKNTEAFDALTHKKIALFDKNPMVRLALRHLLDNWKMHVEEISQFDEIYTTLTIAAETQSPFDCCLISLSLEQSKEQETVEMIKTLEQSLDCRCIILTNTHNVYAIPRPLEKTASGYLAKPICHDKLYDTLTRLLSTNPILTTPQRNTHTSLSAETIPHILVVDDHPANLKLLCALLQELQVSLTPCESGQQAIDLLKSQTFSLVLMDIQMPGMNGIEATQHIRAMENPNQRVPIIAVTAHAMADEKLMLLKCGIDDYVTKPIHETQLKQLIQKWTGCSVRSTRRTTRLPILREPEEDTPVHLAESLVLANYKMDLANELLIMLLTALPQDAMDIQVAWENEDYALLLEKVHKLHGATRYCGVPLLRACAQETETLLKEKKYRELPSAIKSLLSGIDDILQWIDQHYPDHVFYPTHESSHL